MPRLSRPVITATALLLAGCMAEAEPRHGDPFNATGEVIAYGGGGAGANAACFTCHGLRGEGNDAGAPRLAGLPAGYLVKQLEDYADGRRQHGDMARIARHLSHADRIKVAEWYAALPPTSAGAERPVAGASLYHDGDPTRGLPSCASCHGARGEGRGLASPPLAGQPPAYLAEQLRLWRAGKRQNDPRRAMLAISRRLSESEIDRLSAYAASLPGAGAAMDEGRASSPPGRRPDPRNDASAPRPHAGGSSAGAR